MSKRNIILDLEGGGAHGFARGDHHKDQKGGYGKNYFSKSRSHHKDWKGGCGENFISKSRLEVSSFMRILH